VLIETLIVGKRFIRNGKSSVAVITMLIACCE
jgi:hypothetical protein